MAKQVDLLRGSILKSLTALALPIMGSQLVQMAYNLVDMIWVGRVGAGAVAAVGAAGMFMWLSNGLAILGKTGGQVLVAQRLGAGDKQAAARYAGAAIQLATVISLLYTLLMVAGAGPLIGFFKLNSPQVAAQARVYLIIVGLGMFFSFLNQVLIAVVNATGNSHTPFLAMCCGLGLNFVLDPVLIFGVGPVPRMEMAGAALATVLAQVVVFVLLVAYARQDSCLFDQVRLTQRTTPAELAALVRISGPAAVMNVVFPLISMYIARMVAAFGDNAVAVQKVGSQIESISWMTADGFAAAVNSFIGQNYGAGNLKRAKKGFAAAFAMMSLWGVFCSCLLIFAAGPIFGFFIPEQEVLPLGVDYLVILGFSELFMCWEILVEGAYAGLGHTAPPSILSMVLTMARIPLAMVLTSTALGLNGIWWSISISTICKGVILVIMFAVFWRGLQRRMENRPAAK